MDYKLYQILKVDQNSSLKEIKRSYKELAVKWHPDNNPKNSEEAEKKFKDIGKAYKILSDENSRRNYDQFGEEGIIDFFLVPKNNNDKINIALIVIKKLAFV